MEQKHRIVYGCYSDVWQYGQHDKEQLKALSVEVIPEEFSPQMKGKTFVLSALRHFQELLTQMLLARIISLLIISTDLRKSIQIALNVSGESMLSLVLIMNQRR